MLFKFWTLLGLIADFTTSKLIRLFVRLVNDNTLDTINQESLQELDKRGLIEWNDSPKPEDFRPITNDQ